MIAAVIITALFMLVLFLSIMLQAYAKDNERYRKDNLRLNGRISGYLEIEQKRKLDEAYHRGYMDGGAFSEK